MSRGSRHRVSRCRTPWTRLTLPGQAAATLRSRRGPAPVVEGPGPAALERSGGYGALGVDAVLRGDGAQLSGLEVLERLPELGLLVHDERAVPGDRLADRSAAEHEDVELGAARLLADVGADRDGVAGPQQRELAGAQR